MKGLNESKFVAAIIYITSVVLAIKIIAAITLNEYVNVFSFLFATCILITATTTLGLIFIPQVSIVKRKVFVCVCAKRIKNNVLLITTFTVTQCYHVMLICLYNFARIV